MSESVDDDNLSRCFRDSQGTITGDERHLESLGKGELGGVVCGERVRQAPHARQQVIVRETLHPH